MVRAVLLSPFVPLVAIAILGLAMGYRWIALGEFVFVWAIFLYPLVAALAFAGHVLSEWLGCRARRHFAIGGFLVGALLGLGYIYPVDSAYILGDALICLGAGSAGSITSIVFWHLAGISIDGTRTDRCASE